jgi:hypothetical protein
MYKANYDNNIRGKGNSDTYKYRCEAHEALGRRPLRPPPSSILRDGEIRVEDAHEVWYICCWSALLIVEFLTV